MFRHVFLKGLLFTLTITVLVFVSNVNIVKANMFSDLSANVWNSIGDFLFGTTVEEVPPPTVVIPPKVKTTNTVPTPSPVVTKGAGLTTYVTNTLTDDQIYTALTKLKKLPQNIIDLLHVSTPIVTNVYNNSTSGGSGGTVNDTKWHSSGKSSISHSGAVTIDGDLGVTGTSTLADVKPKTSGSITSGITTTEVITGLDGSTYDDSQKFVAIGPDGFPRFVYFDNDQEDLHYVDCLDADCTDTHNMLIVHDDNELDSPTLAIAPDGFARISYNTYDTPNEIHYIKCEDVFCSTLSNVVVDTSDSVGEQQNYNVEVAVGADGLARMVWDNYDGGGDTVKLRFAVCNDANCSAPTLTTLSTDNTGSDYESQAIQMADDGFARIAYVDGQNSEIHYIQCTSDDCSDNSNQVVDTDINGFFIDMVLGSDGFGRIAYDDNNISGEKFAQCTNIDCSNSNITTLTTSADNEISIALNVNDLPRISYTTHYPAPETLTYIECTNTDCSSKNIKTIDTDTNYFNSITIGGDGFARILYVNSDDTSLVLARLSTDDGNDVIAGSTIGTSDTPFGQIYGTQLYLNGSVFDPSTVVNPWTVSGSNISFTGGNVGIGKTNPSVALDISGNVSILPAGGNQTLTIHPRTEGDFHGAPTFTSQNGTTFIDGVLMGTNGDGSGHNSLTLEQTTIENGLIYVAGSTALDGLSIRLGNNSTFQGPLLIKNGSSEELVRFNPSGSVNMVGALTAASFSSSSDYGGFNLNSAYNGYFNLGQNQAPDGSGDESVLIQYTTPTVNIGTNNYPFYGALFYGGGGHNITINSGTSPNYARVQIRPDTYTASAAATLPIAATLWIPSSPQNGTNVTVGKSYAIYAPSGTDYFGGNVGINCSDPDHLLELGGTGAGCNSGAGSYIAAGSTAFTANSSREWKDNIQDFNTDDILTKIDTTHVRTFDWKPEYCAGSDCTNNLGFIAQEFYPVLNRGDGLHINGQDVQMAEWLGIQALYHKFLSLKTDLIAWFADEANGIGDFFANVLNAKEKICVDGECLTKDDVRGLLDIVHSQVPPSSSASVESSDSGDDVPPVDPTPTSENDDSVTEPTPPTDDSSTTPDAGTVTPPESPAPAPDSTPSQEVTP